MPIQAHPLRDEVLQALRNLHHPADLRSSPLLQNSTVRAGLVLANVDPSPDDLAMALANRLEDIIQELRPEGEEDLRQRGWLQYYLLHYLFRRGSNPAAVLRILGISRSYLYQLRGEAADSIATILAAATGGAVATADVPAPLPAAPLCLSLAEPIPSVPSFCGRSAELDLYRRQLQTHNLAVLHGFAGAGKTALAAQLAAERQQAGLPVAWITFSPGVNTDLDSFLQVLACTLADLGFPTLRDWLAAAAREPHLYPADARIHYAVNCLLAAGITLCLDDVHLVENDPALLRFFARLVPRQQPALLPLLVTSRSEPPFALGRCLAPLAGLNEADARALLQSVGLDWLDDAALAELQLHTEGNPVFMKFFAAWTQSAGLESLPAEQRDRRAREFIAQLGHSPSSRSLLLDEVIGALDEAERSTLERIALCRKAVDLSRGAFAPLFSGLEAEEANRALSRLERRNLLTCPSGTALYRPHGLVRRYMRTQLEQAPERRAELHGLLAAYCLHIDDPLEAAYHLGRANRPAEAVELLAGRAEELLESGQAAGILALVEEVPVQALTAEQRLDWYTLLAEAWQAVTDYDQAVACIDQALAQTPEEEYAARYALLLEREQLNDRRGNRAEQIQDLDELERLAEALDDDWRRIEAMLRWASFATLTGDYASALEASRTAVALAQMQEDLPHQALGYWHWGMALRRQADYAGARTRLEQALAMAQSAGLSRLEADSLRVLANISIELDDVSAAIDRYEELLPLYRRLGDRLGEAAVLNNLGILPLIRGDYAQAGEYFDRALHIARETGYREWEIYVLANLGNISFDQGCYEQARACYEQSLQLTRTLHDLWNESEMLIGLAGIYLRQGEPATAQKLAEQALNITRETGSPRVEASALTGLGRAWRAQGCLEETAAALQQAVEIRQRLGERHLTVEPIAGLAEALQVQGQGRKALELIEQVLPYLEKREPDYNIGDLFQIYLDGYQVLQANGDPRARDLLALANTHISNQAARIADESLRHSFLTRVPAVRRLVEIWESVK